MLVLFSEISPRLRGRLNTFINNNDILPVFFVLGKVSRGLSEKMSFFLVILLPPCKSYPTWSNFFPGMEEERCKQCWTGSFVSPQEAVLARPGIGPLYLSVAETPCAHLPATCHRREPGLLGWCIILIITKRKCSSHWWWHRHPSHVLRCCGPHFSGEGPHGKNWWHCHSQYIVATLSSPLPLKLLYQTAIVSKMNSFEGSKIICRQPCILITNN